MIIPGGIDELRDLYDSESWAMMFECQWSEDGSVKLGIIARNLVVKLEFGATQFILGLMLGERMIER